MVAANRLPTLAPLQRVTPPNIMTTLWLDFETRSRCDLLSRGVYNYAQDGSTDVLCMSYAFDDEDVVKTVVSLVGPTDMTDPVFHQYAENYQIGYVFEALFGSTFQENPQLYAAGSPIFQFSNVPTFFLCGALDDLVPAEQSIRMFDTLTANGIMTDTTIFNNAGHDLFGPGLVNKDQTYNELLMWLNTHLVD